MTIFRLRFRLNLTVVSGTQHGHKVVVPGRLQVGPVVTLLRSARPVSTLIQSIRLSLSLILNLEFSR